MFFLVALDNYWLLEDLFHHNVFVLYDLEQPFIVEAGQSDFVKSLDLLFDDVTMENRHWAGTTVQRSRLCLER